MALEQNLKELEDIAENFTKKVSSLQKSVLPI